MSILYKIPEKARYIPTENTFSASFNTPTFGVYDFGIAANTNVSVLKMQANTVYFINALSIGGNIASEDFLSSISTTPKIYLKRKNSGENVYTSPIPILRYFDNKEISAWSLSDKGDDELLITFTGVLNQIIATMGVSPITLAVSLSIYAIDDNIWNAAFRNKN